MTSHDVGVERLDSFDFSSFSFRIIISIPVLYIIVHIGTMHDVDCCKWLLKLIEQLNKIRNAERQCVSIKSSMSHVYILHSKILAFGTFCRNGLANELPCLKRLTMRCFLFVFLRSRIIYK